MKNKSYTKIGPIRRGFEYQDAQALEYFVRWLENPQLYKWIKLEDYDKKYLDDIVVAKSDGSYELVQVKYSVHPECPEKSWDWKNLLEAKNGNRSLFQKWFDSWISIRRGQKELRVIIITNKSAIGLLKGTLCKSEDGFLKINLRKLARSNFYLNVIRKGNRDTEKELKKFLKEIRFEFGKDLDSLWQHLEIRFTIGLGGTKEGWESLKGAAREWTIYKDKPSKDGSIYLGDIRNAAKWFKPKALAQNFPIPDDFVLFDPRLSVGLIEKLAEKSGGIKILYGAPGIGKSTFLSYLSRELGKKKFVVIKHHYYIPHDYNFYERLKYQKAIEGFKHELIHNPILKNSLGDLAYKNLAELDLRQLIERSAKSFQKKRRPLIIIIDGLDHVLRHEDKTTLQEFLKELVPTFKGLWLLLGTQTSALESLPSIVIDGCPEDDRIEIRGFSIRGVEQIIRFNRKGLKLSEDNITSISSKLYKISEGNPLYLRYCINFLKNLDKREIYPDLVDKIPPYDGDIRNYYRELWHNLSIEAKEIAILLASTDISLIKSELVDIITHSDTTPNEFVLGFGNIQHLLGEKRNRIYIFHPSFVYFIKETREFDSINKIIKKRFLSWLKSGNASEDLRWAYTGILECEIGDPQYFLKTLGPNWVDKSIKDARPIELITKQLMIGTYNGFKMELYPKALELGLLLNYVENAPGESAIAWNRIWAFQWNRLNKGIFFEKGEISGFSSDQLVTIAHKAWEKGDDELLNEIFNELNTRLMDEYSSDRGIFGALSRVAAYKGISFRKILRWASHFENREKNEVLKNFIWVYLDPFQDSALNKIIITKDLATVDKSWIIETIATYLLKKDMKKDWLANNTPSELWGPWMLLYAILNNKQNHIKEGKLNIPSPEEFPFKIKDWGGERDIYGGRYFRLFINSFAAYFLGKGDYVEKLKLKCDDRWSHQVYKKIAHIAQQLSFSLVNKKTFRYVLLVDAFNDLDIPNWDENRDILELYFALKIAFRSILLSAYMINRKLKDPSLDTRQIEKFKDFPIFGYFELIDFIIEERVSVLNSNSYIKLLRQIETRLDNEISPFPERAEKYFSLAEIATSYGNEKYFDILLNKSISNLVSHGYHKDIFLFLILYCIEACHKANSQKSNKCIRRLIPALSEVSNYTDGDETNHLPIRLAEVLSLINPELLRRYYLDLADKEELFLAEDLFANIVNSLDLANPVCQAIAKTGIDSSTINFLSERLKKGDRGAGEVLSRNREYFGELSVLEKHDYTESKSAQEDQTKLNVSGVSPDELVGALEKIADFSQREIFLDRWIDFWFSDPTKREESYRIIKRIHLADYSLLDYGIEIIDKSFPYILEFETKEYAFGVLCDSNIKGRGWDKWWTKSEFTFNRWKRIKDHFPDRWKEFLFKTIGRNPYDRLDTFKYFMPVPRIVEFFIYFGDLNTAELLTETLLKFVKYLMGNLRLEEPSWMDKSPSDLHAILLSRLLWPSHIVRERAAESIAELLQHENEFDLIFEKVIECISIQRYETTVILGLLPIIKASYYNSLSIKRKINNILSSINRPSIVAIKLIDELTEIFKEPLSTIEKKDLSSYITKCPSGYKLDTFFLKYIESYMPPWFRDESNIIEEEFQISFSKQWSWEFEKILEENMLKKQFDRFLYYHGTETEPQLVGLTTKISEAYKSSFLRTLYFFYKEGKIPETLYLRDSYRLCPIDIAIWRMSPQKCPDWWPKYPQPVSEDSVDIITPSATAIVQNLINMRCLNDSSKTTLLGAYGPIEPYEGWDQRKINTDFTLVGFAYRTEGSHLPEDKEIIESLLGCGWVPSSLAAHPFTFFENPHNVSYFDHRKRRFYLRDLKIFPLTGFLRTLTIDFWQWFRFVPYAGLYGLSANLFSADIRFNRLNNKWSYFSLNKCGEVGSGNSWVMGIIERHDKERPVPSGQFFEVEKDWLSEYLEENRLRLGFISKLRISIRKYIYEKPSSFEIYKSFNISSLILP
jgi:hypothetical protein